MKVINVYEQYFEAACIFNEVERHAAKVMLVATSDSGMIKYEAVATFFPYNDPEDFVISYDAYVSKVIYEGKGRRSKKKEAKYLESFREEIDELVASIDGEIYWDKPIREASFG
ncbi:MAG: hypothetical protein IJM37_07290 [Lachnospiraceae bacterium]|nr:hypothetical protein [Lachnospiraceae bacterium]